MPHVHWQPNAFSHSAGSSQKHSAGSPLHVKAALIISFIITVYDIIILQLLGGIRLEVPWMHNNLKWTVLNFYT
jgi:hypothetical protein